MRLDHVIFDAKIKGVLDTISSVFCIPLNEIILKKNEVIFTRLDSTSKKFKNKNGLNEKAQ